jgi:hypothetical protein
MRAGGVRVHGRAEIGFLRSYKIMRRRFRELLSREQRDLPVAQKVLQNFVDLMDAPAAAAHGVAPSRCRLEYLKGREPNKVPAFTFRVKGDVDVKVHDATGRR